MTSPSSSPVQASASPVPTKSKRNVWGVVIAAGVVLAVAALVWWFTSRGANYRNGVTSEDRQVVDNGLIAALVSEGESGDALVITDADGSSTKVSVQPGGSRTEETLPSKTSLSELVTGPGAGCEVLKGQCASVSADTITVSGIGELTYLEESTSWQSSTGTTFAAALIFGQVDDLVIGNRTQDQFAGAGETSQIPVDSITAFDRETGEVVWTKYFEQPTLIAVGNNTIYAAETTLQWPEAPDTAGDEELAQRYEQMRDPASGNNALYRLAPATKKNTEVFADAPELAAGLPAPAPTPTASASPAPSATASPTPTPEPTPSETTPAVAPDAIKAFDIRNGYLPRAFAPSEECGSRADDFWQYGVDGPNPSNIHKLPDDPDSCLWFDMVDGDTTVTVLHGNWYDPVGSINHIEYADINGDGYLDALVIGPFWDAGGWFAVIFDPQDPAHPYMAYLYGSQYQAGKLNDAGMLEMWFSDCIEVRIGLSGMPPQVTTFLAPDDPLSVGEQCLE